MRPPTAANLLIVAAGISLPAILGAQAPAPSIWPGMEAGPYAVGHTVRHEYDFSRTFRPERDYFGDPTPGEIARPLQISIWYPAVAAPGASRISVAEYYHAMATETDFSTRTAEDLQRLIEGHKAVLMMEWRVPREAREAMGLRLDSVLAQPSAAVRDASPEAGPFPLILHMPGYDGPANHHYPLFEYLASHGFVVASVPSMGVSSRTIDDERLSLDVQSRDLEFAYSVLRSLPFVDSRRVGTTGMSWGGMANVLFASRNAYVDAVVTLDGAITMPEETGLLESVPGYTHADFHAAYLQLLVTPAEARFRPKDLRFWDALRYSDALSAEFSGVEHDDFSPGNVRLRNLAEEDPARAQRLESFARVEMEIVRRFLQAALAPEWNPGRGFPELGVPEGAPAGLVVGVERKEALRPPPSPDAFSEILRNRGVEAAAAVWREVQGAEPRSRLVTSPVMGPLFMEAMEGGDLPKALAICELWAVAMPDDVGPLFSTARVYGAMGDKARAIAAYERILTMVPEGPQADSARRALQELKGGG